MSIGECNGGKGLPEKGKVWPGTFDGRMHWDWLVKFAGSHSSLCILSLHTSFLLAHRLSLTPPSQFLFMETLSSCIHFVSFYISFQRCRSYHSRREHRKILHVHPFHIIPRHLDGNLIQFHTIKSNLSTLKTPSQNLKYAGQSLTTYTHKYEQELLTCQKYAYHPTLSKF